jgi:phenylacetate-CoA ligase
VFVDFRKKIKEGYSMAKNASIYWNPLMETMPREKLRELQVKKFKRIFEWAYKNSPFYKKLYKDAGMEPGDIKTYEDIKKVPKTDKGMLRDVQNRPPFPYGDMLAVPLQDVTEFRQTSGTTGTPV